MTEHEAYDVYLRLCKEGTAPEVWYNAASDDLLVFPFGNKVVRIHYARITDLVWAYAGFGDILFALRAAILLYKTMSHIALHPIDFPSTGICMAEKARSYGALTLDDTGFAFSLDRYRTWVCGAEMDALCGIPDSSEYHHPVSYMMQNEFDIVRQIVFYRRRGCIPHIWLNLDTRLLSLIPSLNPATRYNVPSTFFEISILVWGFEQFGDILTAVRAAKLMYDTLYEHPEHPLDPSYVRSILADIAAHNPMFADEDSTFPILARFEEKEKKREYRKLEGKWEEE